MTRLPHLRSLGCIVLSLAIFGQACRQPEAGRVDQAKPAEQRTPVTSTPREAVVLTGVLAAVATVEVRPVAGGIVEKVLVQPGETVAEGQALATLTQTEFHQRAEAFGETTDSIERKLASWKESLAELQTASARATKTEEADRQKLQQAQKDFDRQRALWESGAIARLEFEKAQRDLGDARARQAVSSEQSRITENRIVSLKEEIRRAEEELEAWKSRKQTSGLDLSAAEVHAPSSGVVAKVYVKAGDSADLGSPHPLLEIARTGDAMEVRATGPPELLRTISPGDRAHIRCASNESSGVIQTISASGVVVKPDASPTGKAGQPCSVTVEPRQ